MYTKPGDSSGRASPPIVKLTVTTYVSTSPIPDTQIRYGITRVYFEVSSDKFLDINLSDTNKICPKIVGKITVDTVGSCNSGYIAVIVKMNQDYNGLYPAGDPDKQPYVLGDEYNITFVGGSTINDPKIRVDFKRTGQSRFQGQIAIFIGNMQRLTNKVSVPTINIKGQTLVDGSDVGNIIFEILDKYSYYKKHDDKISNNGKCEIEHINPDNLKITIFEKCCPKMVLKVMVIL